MSKMLEEIRQQPAALERTFRSELKGVEKLRTLFEKNRPKFIILAARGTSDNAAQFGRYLLEIATGIPVSLAAPSIFTLYGARVDYKDALVVAISQSGESTDTNLVLERARECGAFTVGITNESSSTLAKIAEHVILVRAGREKSVAATKTYTGQLMAIYMLAYALGAPVSLDELRAMPEAVAGALKLEAEIREMIDRVHGLGAETLIITDLSNKEAASMKGTRAIVLPSPLHRQSAVPEELYTPLPYIVPAQILAACLAEEKGLNPDQPRALEKVTRTM